MNNHQRPDPDQLLAHIQQEAAKATRGKLKIFFGAAAGVGKTFAMLSAAKRQLELGGDVISGVIETHGRRETEALLADLEQLPLRDIAYRGKTLKEFDIDAALRRRPALILVDELAHSNVTGSRHPKRWQDVHELLEAGIDVYTSVNVQHLETLNDVITGITGIRVWETVPDKVFNEADEVVLVDLPPDELLQRLQEGKVYLPQQAERAIANFFRKGNLIALRELALRRAADRIDNEMRAYRRHCSVDMVWQTSDALLVCIGRNLSAERLVRAGARLAERLEVPWHVVHIETMQGLPTQEVQRHLVLKALELAGSLGAETTTISADNLITAIIGYAREHNLARVIVGRDRPRHWYPWYRSLADRIGHIAPDLDVIQIARNETVPIQVKSTTTKPLPFAWLGYFQAMLVCAGVTILTIPLAGLIEPTNIAMLFLLAVLTVAVFFGRGPAVLAAFLAVAAFDFFFVPPRFTFAVSDAQYLVTFAVMLTVALITGQFTASYKQHAKQAMRRERQARAMYAMARDLSAALLPEQIIDNCNSFLAAEFASQAALLITDADDNLQPAISAKIVVSKTPVIDEGVARWVFDHGEAAGLGTDTLPGSTLLYLPLKAPMRIRGVLAIAPRDPLRIQGPEVRRQLETFANLIAIAIERMHYVDVAQKTLLQMESEGLRNSLLAAISHDLRTPLSVLVSLTESLKLTQPPLTDNQNVIVDAIYDATQRSCAQVTNLLDMARLQAGKVHLNCQWQPLEEIVGSALKTIEIALVNHPVQVKLPEDLPLLEVDAVLIERVLCNLLDNASKHTPANTCITISAIVNTQEVSILVEDNGPGLVRGHETIIFQKFERGVRESTVPGVGLGLTICQAIIEAHGGTISAENLRTGGARFVFKLPRGVPPMVIDTDKLV